ncbi:ATP-binding protein [uncultured Mucilaginibacter sp.]|uniref:ATP-dependent nuclease n=1 Tax=uncultured Mucilaginibacter sp. TaxID=797541 RepID=UPI0025FC2590|nr:ATP-binding protein [uncultured Mucilaginibacter sp.]
MKITAIEIENIRCFKSVPRTELSKSINIFIGPNNTGKTTILKSIYLLQYNSFDLNDITQGHDKGEIKLSFIGENSPYFTNDRNLDTFFFELNRFDNKIKCQLGLSDDTIFYSNFSKFPEHEPQNLIYPYLSKRKVNGYNGSFSETNGKDVTNTLTNLPLRIDKLITRQGRASKIYFDACIDVLGFEVRTIAVNNDKVAAYYTNDDTDIPITAMGEGVANVLGLITQLCIAKGNKIFIIEEIENDIHPKALKALLRLIVDKSSSNQFFISTHSNIVMKYLGSESDAKIFKVNTEIKDENDMSLFVSKLAEISTIPEARRQVLEDLGYEFFDFDLWEFWLFLEESSAEVLIREYFINWFTNLSPTKIRTFSSGGVEKLKSRFEDFNKLFVFLHLQPTYKNKVWVLIDSGDREREIINDFNKTYVNEKNGWSKDNFRQLTKHDFEEYYPAIFQERVIETLAINNSDEKRKAKKLLLDDVKSWIKDNPEKAKEEFEKSAADVIEHLKFIEKQINS